MPSYRVESTGTAAISAIVEASDPEEAVDKFYDTIPNGVELCVNCSGYWKDYSLEVPDTWEAEAVYDNDALDYENLWEGSGFGTESLIQTLRSDLAEAEAEVKILRAELAALKAR